MRKAFAVARKEFRQIVRDARTLLILLFVPAFFLLLYGYALNFDIRHIPLAVDDRDKTSDSRELVSAFVNSGYFDYVADIESPADIEELMDRNRIRAALVIPPGMSRDLLSGRDVSVQILIDGDNANTATTVLGYSSAIARTVSRQIRVAHGDRVQPPPVMLEPRIWYNPELRSTLFLVPGLIAYICMITAVVSTALSVVREKERGTMEQVRMAPIDTLSYVLGKTAPYFVVSLVSAMVIVLVSMWLFGLPMRGSWPVLLLALSLFIVGALATGLWISTIADTQQTAFQLALLSSFLPTLMLSGFIFPIASMPAFIRGVTYIVPARYFLVALRGIVLKGTPPSHYAFALFALVAYAAGMLTLAAFRLTRQRVA